MKWNSRLVILISLVVMWVKTESTNTDYDITPLAGCVGQSYTYNNLFDKKIYTYWSANKCTFEEQDNVWCVSFKTSRLVEVAGYKITLAHIIAYNSGSNPKSWILKAREKEDQSWEIIDERTDERISAVNNGIYIFNVNKPGNYQYFAFVVTSLQGGPSSNILLGELWLLSSCPNDDIAPEIGCTGGEITNVCGEGQICNSGVCLYPPPTLVSVIFLIIGLFFALTLILVCFILWFID